MKRVVSISLGSHKRDHKVETEIAGELFEIERIGTDGNVERAIQLIHELDGKVDVFGMGGIDIYLNGGNRRYVIKDALPIMNAARFTPIVDGTFVKNTLERKVIRYIREKNIIELKNKKVLMTCGLDRFGMSEALLESGCLMTFGDAIFSLGWNFPMHSIRVLQMVARVIAPIACRMPFEKIYPTGQEQYERDYKYIKYFDENEIIAGDFLYIKKYMPDDINGKIIITNTVTAEDVKDLKRKGAGILITTTPELDGRSFGTNVIEGILTALSGKKPSELSEQDFERLIDMAGMKPRIEYLNDLKESMAF